MNRSKVSLASCACLLLAAGTAAATRPLRVDDVYSLRDVDDPRVSPDGAWVAYTVTHFDRKADEQDTDVYMAPFGGGEPVRLTASRKAETRPRWSPDGRHLAFLSCRGSRKTQVWLLDRRGGEATRLTTYPAGVSDLAWSPDGKRLALVVRDTDPRQPKPEDEVGEHDCEAGDDDEETDPPIVIRRRQFKRDGSGYLTDLRSHVHVFDLQTRTTRPLTAGAYDDRQPAWSPDGSQVAFVSNRSHDPDANQNTDVFVVPADGGMPRALTTHPGTDRSPAWSPDGKWVAYVNEGDPDDMWYAASHVAVVAASGGTPRALTASLDRNVSEPRFTPDGAAVLFLIEDGGNSHLGRVPVAGGAVERVVGGEREVSAFDVARSGAVAVLESQPQRPAEVWAVDGGSLRPLSRANDAFLAGIELGRVERFQARSADGTRVDGFLTHPPGPPSGKRPAILRIHGGPTSQYSTGFEREWQMLAAHGYLVIAANPRGSTGYGTAFSRAIWADWGNKDYEDVMAAVDHAVASGAADPERLGVGGWSYGGILTDVVITKTQRFKAAVSGASMANHLAGYGTDHYQYEWEKELGLPWKNPELWVKLSPFFRIDRVTTPTLVVVGQDDMNVPLLASEQLYQALRRVGVPTELVIYPGQNHGIETPSYVKDRYERYLAWYDRYLRPEAMPATAAGASAEATSLSGRPLFAPALTAERRRALEANLAKANADFVKDPEDPEAIIWVARRLGYLGRYREAIAVLTRGIAKHPEDIRLLRHRGHRYISVRELDRAVADLARAARLIETKKIPDAVEPDGDPNPQGVPTSTSHFNVYYHLGLAHYLKGDFEKARAAYRECMKYSKDDPDRLVATSDWLYMTLRRLGREAEAAQVLEPISAALKVVENDAYWNRLLMYKGEKSADALLGASSDPLDVATYGYGIGNWHLYNGRREQALEVFRRVVAGEMWPAFGFIAAEAELARLGASDKGR
jgi:dipeptidyl aminopeptidase/acylaminoacyl peptidase/tetratricopeptide (TPR) repeat protein